MSRVGELQTQALPLPFDPSQVNFVASDFGNTVVGAVNDVLSGNVRVANSIFGGVPKVFSALPPLPAIPQPASIQSLPELPGLPAPPTTGQSSGFPGFPQLPPLPGQTTPNGGTDEGALGFPSLGNNSEDFWNTDLDFRE